MNPQLAAYLKMRRSQQVSDTQISQELIQAGWDQNEVNLAVHNFNPTITPLVTDHTKIPNTANSKLNTKRGLIIIIAVVLLMIAGVSAYFLAAMHQSTDKKNVAIEEPSPIQYPQANSQNNQYIQNLIALENAHQPDSTNTISFYNLSTMSKTEPDPQINQPNTSYHLYSWSPDGKKILINAVDSIDTNNFDAPRYSSLFTYDPIAKLVTTITSQSINNITKDSEKFLPFTMTPYLFWLDLQTISPNIFPNSETKIYETKYITLDGSIGKNTSDRMIKTNNHVEITYSLDTPIGTPIEVKIDGQAVTPPPGEIIGYANDQLVSLYQPEGIKFSMGSEDPEDIANEQMLAEEMMKLEQQGASQEEQSKKMSQLMAPQADTVIYFSDSKSGEINQQINLTYQDWYTSNAQLIPHTSHLVARQKNNYLLETKERFIIIDPNTPDDQLVLFENAIDTSTSNTIARKSMYTDNEFSLSSDGKWLIGYADSQSTDRFDTAVYAYNLESKLTTTICRQCAQVQVYNPTEFTYH
jgi:hypothetical protein